MRVKYNIIARMLRARYPKKHMFYNIHFITKSTYIYIYIYIYIYNVVNVLIWG